MWNKRYSLRCALVVGLAATLSATFPTYAQRFPAGSSRVEDILRDAESAAGMVTSGKLLYTADLNKRTWGQYCRQSLALADRGEFRAAVRAASKALFLGEQGDGVVAVAIASRDLAYAYNFAGELDRAEEWAKRSNDAVLKGNAQTRNVGFDLLGPNYKVLGDVALRRGDAEGAAKHYEMSLSEAGVFSSNRTPVRIALVNTEIKRGRFAEARKRLDDIGNGGDWSAMVRRARGQLAMAEKDYAKAVEHYSAAVAAMKGEKDFYNIMWMQQGLGQALVAAGQRDQGLAAYQEAITTAKLLRSSFRTSEFRAGFFGDIQSIYDDAIGLLVDLKRHDEALALSEESRARALLDVLKGRANAENTNTTDAIRQIPANTAVVVYHVLNDRTIAWTVRPEGVTTTVISSGRKELAVVVGRFRRALLSRASDTAGQGQKLYEILIQPLGLKSNETLIAVPHRALHYLPIQALGGKQGYLIEERAISSMPSLNGMQAIVSGAASPKAALFALGNPTLDEVNMALPGAEREVTAIGGLYPDAKVLVRDNASKPNFVSQAPGNGLIHVAAHAFVDEIDPLFSSIRLAKAGQPTGELEAHEILKMNLSNTRLVTLSACESGLGKVSDGDEFYGFKRTFLAAGAKSLLVSLWSVEDESTANLMSVFYKELQTRPMAEALRQAQLSLIKSGAHADPAFWAPFMLVGDWR